MSTTDDLRIGIIGLRLGQWHVETIAELAGARVTAVADNVTGNLPGTELTMSQYADSIGAKAYTDGVDLILNGDVDAVSICVSPKWRLPLVEAAARRKMPVMIEKPWGINLEHGKQLARILQDAGVLCMVEFPLRFFPPMRELKCLLYDGSLGKPYMVNSEIVMVAHANKNPNHWLWDPNNGNGVINENTSHVMDTICYLLGDPVSVHAFGGNFSGVASTPDGAVVNVQFANGSVASVTGGGLGSFGLRMRSWFDVFAAEGQALVTGLDHMIDTLTWAQIHQMEPTVQTWPNPPRRQIMRYSMQHFIECVRDGKQPEVGIVDGVKALALSMAVNDSIQTGQPVEVNWQF